MKKIYLHIALLLISLWQPATAIEPGQRFVTVAFHDVVDSVADIEDDTVTTDRLIAFFDFLKGDGWTVLTLDDVQAAKNKTKTLPAKSVLITFDDGYESLYSRVFPLALAYNYPIVAALVGEWMDAPPSAMVPYGGKLVPRTKFLSWDAAREMQRSGLVEFASHTYSLHKDVLANPQGNRMPIAITQRFDEATGTYESQSQYEQFLIQNFKLDRAIFKRELKKLPRALVWPFGRYSEKSLDIAKRAGYQFALTLDPEPSDAADLLRIARYLPTRDPKLGEEIEYLRFQDRLPTVQRMACLDPAELISNSAQEFDRRLGVFIERTREMGVTNVVIPAAFVDQNQTVQSWFPTSASGVKSDDLSRIVWQVQTRAGVSPTISVPLKEMQRSGMSQSQIDHWFQDLGRMVPVQSLLIRDLQQVDRQNVIDKKAPVDGPWQTRAIRNHLDLTALPAYEQQAFKGVKTINAFRPGVQLYTLKHGEENFTVSDAIDLTLFTTSIDKNALNTAVNNIEQAGLLSKETTRRRVGLWLTDLAPPNPDQLSQASLYFQAHKGTAIGWCPDLWLQNHPNAAEVAPAVSAARFPLRP